jgi:hypothetical protein
VERGKGRLMMKKHLIFLVTIGIVLFISSVFVSGKEEESITNETIVKMVNAKVGDTLVIRKIRTSKTSFDLSTDAIINLKKEGVSDKVIEEMMNAEEKRGEVITRDESKIPPASEIPMHGSQTQVYILLKDGIRVPMPYAMAGNDYTRGKFLIFDESGSSLVYSLTGEKSQTGIVDAKPTFLVNLQSGLSQEIVNIKDELMLAKLDPKKGLRYVAFTTKGMRHTVSGTKQEIEVISEKTEDGSFKITPKEPLQPGEYAFIFKKDRGIDLRFYDFGIEGPEGNSSRQITTENPGGK